MQIKYLSTAWNDIRQSPGWLAKALLLGLVACIPIFGWIVVYGYLYGWARDMAWGVHAPLPARIFGNEDGKLYSRGFFVLVIAFVFSLLPGVIEVIGVIIGSGPFWFWGHSGYGFGLFSVGIGGLVFVASIAAMFFVVLFSWVGSMRMSIYGRLSAGFQFGKIWSMVRHDFGGLLRILGMAIVLAIGIGVVVAVLALVVVLVAFLVGVLATGGNLNINAPYLSGPVLGLTFAVGGVSILLSAVAGYGGMVVAVFTIMMVTRALGYWTRQFDVPAWRGQDDPMPFEMRGVYPPRQ